MLNPFFDIARQHLTSLYTAEARKLVAMKQWSLALAMLQRALPSHPSDSWLPDQKEAYVLRSEVYKRLHQPAKAIDDLSLILRVEPSDPSTLLARAKLYQAQLQGRAAKYDFDHACMLGSLEACQQLP